MSNVTSVESETNPEWLDPEQFPFTESEVREAATLWRNYGEAVDFARALAELEKKTVRQRTVQRAEEEARPADPNHIVFTVKRAEDPSSNWLWPALSVLSASCSSRVHRWMSLHWEARQRLLVFKAQTDELKLEETMAEIFRLHSEGGDQGRIRALVEQVRRDREERKLPTDEMRRAASETVEREKAAWLALALESQRRFDASRSTTDSPPATPPRP